jgi:cobalt-zinc-cadmium efflux system outer membrane protein
MAYCRKRVEGWAAAGGAPARLAAVLLSAALAWAGPCAASAEPVGGPPPLTLADALRLALERNADFRVAETQVDAALAQLRVVREFPNPTLGLSTAKISTDGTPEGTAMGNGLLNRSYDSIVSLSQLFVVGKRGLQRDAARAGVQSAQFQRDDARRLLVQAVTQAYAAALAALSESDVLSDSAAKLRREADIAAHRLKAGDLSASDEAQLEIAADQDELNADAERATAKTAVVTLEILLGNPSPAGTTPLADSLDKWTQSIDPGLEEAPIGSRPDIAAAESSLRQADTNVRLEERQKVPDVTASVQFERNPPVQPDTVGFGLSLPLPLWDRFDGEVLAAKAARAQTQAQLDKVRIQAAADVAAARVAYHEASQRSMRYRTSLVPKSAEVARSVSYAYGKGGATLVDLLEAERNDNLIRVGAVQAEADAASTAVSLQAALGLIGAPGSN